VDSCVVCEHGGPTDVLRDLGSVWVTAGRFAPLPGYVCVVAKRHVREPYELPLDEGAAFWRSALLAAQAVASLLAPRKMNYEIHGNTLPHLHMHLFPRFDGDPFEGRPIDGSSRTFERTDEDLAALAAAIDHAAATGGLPIGSALSRSPNPAFADLPTPRWHDRGDGS
jgi:diadenosine tetraphosphate (Ap4A) HIT family hydrolase